MIDLLNYYNNELFPFSTPPLVLTILNMFLIWMNILGKKDKIANWFLIVFFVLSLIPLINAIALLIFILYTVTVTENQWFFRKKRNTMKDKLKKLNTLVKCSHCEVMFRKGYIQEKNHCPICDTYNEKFIYVENQKIYDERIPEQAIIKKETKNDKKKDLLEEQNELYIKAKQEKLTKK